MRNCLFVVVVAIVWTVVALVVAYLARLYTYGS